MNLSRRLFLQQTVLASFSPLATSASFANGLEQTEGKTGMRLILLGTAGGPTPKKNRAAPAQMILINGEAYVIDCGNGVAQQIVKAGVKLSAVRHVFLTHHHSDHNADYGNLMLLAWAADLNHRIDTYGPAPIKRMTQQFLALNDFDIQTRIQDEGRHPLKTLIVPHEIPHSLKNGGLVLQNEQIKVTATQVLHPPIKSALAYRFEHAGKSIVISGDTTYSENLVKLAKDADVLVHEIMHTPALDQLLATEPNATRLKEHLFASHSTAEQVGRVASEARVKKLVLSHFVPGGYPYLEDSVWLNAVRPYFDGEIVVGSDLMEIAV